ncbi:MAG: DUF4147 domain-containing protein [Cocleimonas sp.]|nr:DUF4147 domain-containing protein [Cocleimonas sp.]
MRNILLGLYPAALEAVNGHQAVYRQLDQRHYQKQGHLIAIGKAAEAMALGAVHYLGDALVTGLVISKHGHFSSKLSDDPRFICLEADHPLPQTASLTAGNQLIKYLQQLPKQSACLILISGGASSLVEVLHDGWRLIELQEVTQYLLANAYPIERINAVRCQLSKIKAGGLWHYLEDQQVTCLMVSDVADNDPCIIGSGLLFPSNKPLPTTFPWHWKHRFKAVNSPSVPHFDWYIVATLEKAKQAVARLAMERGYGVTLESKFIRGDAEASAIQCAEQLKQSTTDIIIWGGETTVNLPDDPPLGGRNQHFALAAAIALQGTNYALLSLGTDGSDGTSADVAGALVDGKTLQRGRESGLSAKLHLQRCDAHAFLAATEDLIVTGATGTNVMDLIIGIKGCD